MLFHSFKLLALAVVVNSVFSANSHALEVEAKVAANDQVAAHIDTNGDLWMWGWNKYGQLGQAGGVFKDRPAYVGSGFREIAVGREATCAIKGDGSLWAWGLLSNGVTPPTMIGSGFSMVSTGTNHCVAIDQKGGLWTVGSNRNGQLGNGGYTSAEAPVRIGEGYTSIASLEDFNVALKKDGTLWFWGEENITTPTRLKGNNYTSVYLKAYGSIYAIASDGGVYEWSTKTATQASPKKVGTGYQKLIMNYPSDPTAKSASCFGRGLVGVKADGTYEQLWYGNTVRIEPLIPLKQVAGSDATYILALTVDNQIVESGAMPKPTNVEPYRIGSGFSTATANEYNSLGVRFDGSLWSWSQSGTSTYYLGNRSPIRKGDGFETVAARGNNFLALKRDGSLWAWGENQFGQIGNGSKKLAVDPVKIGDGYKAIAAGAYHSLGLKHDGTLWTWGHPHHGQVAGDASLPGNTQPVQIGFGVKAIAAGFAYSAILQDDGRLWIWGLSSPDGAIYSYGGAYRGMQVDIGYGFKQVAAGLDHVLALRDDGTLLSWGSNQYGQLGTNYDRYVPGVNIRPYVVGSGFTQIAAGDYRSFAFKDDGSLWAWGKASYGKLCLPPTTYIPYPYDVVREPIKIGSGYRAVFPGDAFTMLLSDQGELLSCGVVSSFGGSPQAAGYGDCKAGLHYFDPLMRPEFSLSVKQRGTLQHRTAEFELKPAEKDLGKQGHYFILAKTANGQLAMASGLGWKLFDAAKPQAWSASNLDTLKVQLLENQNIEALLGTEIYLGYGVGSTPIESFQELTNSRRFARGAVLF